VAERGEVGKGKQVPSKAYLNKVIHEDDLTGEEIPLESHKKREERRNRKQSDGRKGQVWGQALLFNGDQHAISLATQRISHRKRAGAKRTAVGDG